MDYLVNVQPDKIAVFVLDNGDRVEVSHRDGKLYINASGRTMPVLLVEPVTSNAVMLATRGR